MKTTTVQCLLLQGISLMILCGMVMACSSENSCCSEPSLPCTVKTRVYYLHACHVNITQTCVHTHDVALTQLIHVCVCLLHEACVYYMKRECELL